jgi:hypothetical protein
MNRVAIGYSTFNKTELIQRSIEPLLQPDRFDLFIADGSTQPDTIKFLHDMIDGKNNIEAHFGVRGGSGPAIVYLLTAMLNHDQYDYIGLIEADVVLGSGWFSQTIALFERGWEDGLTVGAVSARCYEDRILCQMDGYAVLHNTGAGMIIFTREVAQLVLDYYRTQKTVENRAIFSQLAGVDIARYWAFRGADHWLVADWRWDALLASQGWATVGLTPSPVEMIGQNPPLAQQGLTLSTGPFEPLIVPDTFKLYRDRLQAVKEGQLRLPDSKFHVEPGGFVTTFPHQIASLGGFYEGEWRLKDSPGFGPFAWRATEGAVATIPVYGPCELFIGGGKDGAKVRVVDEFSGYDISPSIGPEGDMGSVMTISVPGNVGYRNIVLTALTEGSIFYGIRTREPQPINPNVCFNYKALPPV